MDASTNIIDRIKKLLRLGADARGNAHEAERAMALAFELAEKHRVDVAALDLDKETARVVHEHWHIGQRFDRLRRGIFSLLQAYFHVSVCVRSERMLVVGRTQDVMIAKYVHDFLLRTGRECLRTYEAAEKADRRRVTTNKRASYVQGFIYGIAHTLQKSRGAMPDLTDTQTGLLVQEEIERDRMMHDIVGATGKTKALPERKNRTALEAGFSDGRATTISQPLGGATGGTLLLQ